MFQDTFYCSSVNADQNLALEFSLSTFLSQVAFYVFFLTRALMFDVQHRFSAMVNLFHLSSTDVDRGVCVFSQSTSSGRGWEPQAVVIKIRHSRLFRYRNDGGCVQAGADSLLWVWDTKNVSGVVAHSLQNTLVRICSPFIPVEVGPPADTLK